MYRLICATLPLVLACSGDNGVSKPAAAIPGGSPTGDTTAQVEEGAAVALTEDMAAPYFGTGPAAAAYRAFELEEWKEAKAGFAAYLAGDDAPTDPANVARVRLLIAIADSHLRNWDDAAAGFEKAAAGLPLIADYINYEAARARYFARDLDDALALARKVAPDSIRGADAELLVGDLLRARGDHAAIAAHYQKYISDRPEGIRLDEVHFRLAEALEAAGGLDEAAVVYRTASYRWPHKKWGKEAAEKLAAILPKLSKESQEELQRYRSEELIEKGMALYDAMRNPWSAATFEEALEAPGLTAEQECVARYHLANSWFKERDRTKAAPLFDAAMAACDKTDNVDLRVKAAYQAGRSYDRISQEKTAAARFARCEEIAAKHDHSYADDARLRQAEAYMELGNSEKEAELLATIPDRYPDGDMRAEAIWRLAWRAYRKGDYGQTIKWLEKQIASKPIEDKYYAEGQPQYWLGRAYGKLGKTAESIAAYRDAVMKYPLTYYALLSLNRLRESHPKAYASLLERIKKVPDDFDPKAPAFQFKARPLYGEAGFRRGIEFLKLGLGWASEAELSKLGLTPPDGRDEVTDPDEREKLWAMAFLHHNAGRYGPSHWVTRWHVLDFKRSWPTGANRARWEIAYPKAYWQLLSEHASKHGYPVELQIAIVREESAFDPLRESWANAIGLTQMIFVTAERFGKGTGIEITRENLRDPVKNVTIGSNFLGFLWDKWEGHTALVPPSYNAGENGVARWLRQRGSLDTDEWSEEIPGDQPRRYSKRVLSSYFVYAYLYGGDIPKMRNDIPKSIIPKARKRSRKRGKKDYGNYAD